MFNSSDGLSPLERAAIRAGCVVGVGGQGKDLAEVRSGGGSCLGALVPPGVKHFHDGEKLLDALMHRAPEFSRTGQRIIP